MHMGESATSANAFRPFSGSCEMLLLSITCPTDAFSVFTSGASAVT